MSHNAISNPFDSLTDAERAEYGTWSDSANIESPSDWLEYHYTPDDEIPDDDMEAWLESLPEDCQCEPITDDELDSPIASSAAGEKPCDCGKLHNHRTFLNCSTGNYLCQSCVESRYEAERQSEAYEREMLRREVEYLSNPENMFREFLITRGAA